MTACIDCGLPGPDGTLRCRRCYGLSERMRAARELAEDDRELLRLVDDVKLPKTRIAVRLGVSAAAVGQRVARARKRQAVLEESR